MTIQIHQFNCRSDNFGVLIRDPATGLTALIDAPEESTVEAAIAETGWKPDLILTTHHHIDHVEANEALKRKYGLKIYGPAAEADRIPCIDVQLKDGDRFDFAGEQVEVIETPGHTAGHIVYYFPKSGVLFAADTLFALGCGRLLERGPQDMHGSLARLAQLPPETAVYCGHEYTLSNARFAVTVDPDNERLAERAKRIEALRAEGKPTLPTTIGEELATNPFLRWDDEAIRRTLGLEDAQDWEVFAEIRKRKDNF